MTRPGAVSRRNSQKVASAIPALCRGPRASYLLQRPVIAYECEQALVLLAAGRAALEVRMQPGGGRVRICTCDLELDVLVEACEALVAADLGLSRPDEAPERLLQISAFVHVSSSESHVWSANPESPRCLRSFRQASCNVL